MSSIKNEKIQRFYFLHIVSLAMYDTFCPDADKCLTAQPKMADVFWSRSPTFSDTGCCSYTLRVLSGDQGQISSWNADYKWNGKPTQSTLHWPYIYICIFLTGYAHTYIQWQPLCHPNQGYIFWASVAICLRGFTHSEYFNIFCCRLCLHSVSLILLVHCMCICATIRQISSTRIDMGCCCLWKRESDSEKGLSNQRNTLTLIVCDNATRVSLLHARHYSCYK